MVSILGRRGISRLPLCQIPRIQIHTILLSRSLSTEPAPSLRNLIKPFLLKCHPDVQQSPAAKAINLTAIQSLNAYLDAIESLQDGQPVRRDARQQFSVDFVLESGEKKVAQSRRKLELVVPSTNIERQARQQLAKLLQVAGLQAPPMIDLEEDFLDEEPSSPHSGFRAHHRSPAADYYRKSRDRFTSNLNWHRYDQLYTKAVADMQANLATSGMVRQSAARRRRLIAGILANVRVGDDHVSEIEQLIALRRLSLLLEQHFDDLHLDDFGHYWQNCRIVLKPARGFNTSSSSLHRRRRRNADTGFVFVLRSNAAVEVHVPVDFDDAELVRELDRNVWDFYDVVGDGMDSMVEEAPPI